MSSLAQQQSIVKESLFQFVTKNIPSADLSVIDDIVLSYVTSILEEASQDPCFDVEGFVEMMSAYFPDFSNIDASVVCSWIFELEAELSSRHNDSTDSNDSNDSAGSDKISLTLQCLHDMLPVITNENRSHSTSESSDGLGAGGLGVVGGLGGVGGAGADCEPDKQRVVWDESYADQCVLLQDMFPNSCALEIKHCISIARGDVERAAQTLLHRRDTEQSLALGSALHPVSRHTLQDDAAVRSRIIERYSYVDSAAEAKEHRPLAPKFEPKKLVRYRDNKIVSLKGERYTEVAKNGADDNLKKPKRQHCP